MNSVPDIHDTDDRDYEDYLRGGFRPDPEIVKWHNDAIEALVNLGLDKWSATDTINGGDIKLRYDIDPEDFVEGLRFCGECDWEGLVDDLDCGCCPKCHNHNI